MIKAVRCYHIQKKGISIKILMLINHFLSYFFQWTDGNPLWLAQTFFFAVGVLNNFIPQNASK